MPRLAANLTTMFTELPFLDRVGAAADCGFAGVEFQFPYAVPAADLADRLLHFGVTPVLFNLPAGDVAAGERGCAALPGRTGDFREGLHEALTYARTIGCRQLHVMAGVLSPQMERADGEAVFVANLREACDLARPDGVTLLIEPLNVRDNPGYFLRTTAEAVAVLDRVERPNIGLQLDFYHCQISEGDLARHATDLPGRYAHVQIAGVPGRHEPDRGEINYRYLLDLLDDLDYRGWVGCEYLPAAGTWEGLDWARPWGIRRSARPPPVERI